MDYSSLILNLLKEKEVKFSINPIIYYGLKTIYKKDFQKRSIYFSKALNTLFESLGCTLDISLFQESFIERDVIDETAMNDTLLIEMGGGNCNPNNNMNDITNLNMTVNKDNYVNMTGLFNSDWKWSLLHLVDYDDEYILDKEDDYVLIKLIKNLLFSDEDARTSQLLISYNVFVSSIELIFCLKLVENFPKVCFNPREMKKYEKYIDGLKNKINTFFKTWTFMYNKKYQNSLLIQSLIGNNLNEIQDTTNYLDLISLSMLEPLLTTKYISFTKLIREGPFCFEIEEIARQLCIVDHEMLSSLNITDYNSFMVRRNAPESFNKFYIREKQLRCYILLFILMQNALENKRIMIQNFILLAQTCKLLNNYQSCYTIISTLNMVGLLKKKLLWKLIEKKYREVFTNLENELNEIEANDNQQLLDKNIVFPSVPCVDRIKNNINNLILKIKYANNDEKIKISKEYKDFYLCIEEIGKNKYSFFKINPLYDFFKFGFLEIFKPKKWNLKLRIDFSQYTEDSTQLDQLLEFLINGFKKLDS
jgi:hypothetical protein